MSPDAILKCWKSILCYTVDNDHIDAATNSYVQDDSDNDISDCQFSKGDRC